MFTGTVDTGGIPVDLHLVDFFWEYFRLFAACVNLQLFRTTLITKLRNVIGLKPGTTLHFVRHVRK